MCLNLCTHFEIKVFTTGSVEDDLWISLFKMRTTAYRIQLKAKEREDLHSRLRGGREKSRVLTRCRILLLTHEGKEQGEIAKALGVSRQTIAAVCNRYLSGGLDGALYYRPLQDAISAGA
jgi:Trp operon repressor